MIVDKLTVLDTFAGIGGFSYGLEQTGYFETIAFCEIEKYPQKVLTKHWPGVPIYDDIRELTADRLRSDGIIRRPDVITGGFPCTDVSLAGKQAGIAGQATGLWKELARTIGEFRPSYAILENVAALLSGDRGRWFGEVLGDLAAIGYDAEWHCITAASIGAPHRRDRVFVIATDTQRGALREQFGRGSSGAPEAEPRHDGEAQPLADADVVATDGRGRGTGPLCGGRSESTDLSGGESILADADDSGRQPGSGVERGPTEAGSPYRNDSERRSGIVADSESVTERAGLCESGEGGERRGRFSDGRSQMPETIGERLEGLLEARAAAQTANRSGDGNNSGWWTIEPDVGRVAYGIPARVDRLKCLGNAIVPQIAEMIGYAIAEYEASIEVDG